MRDYLLVPTGIMATRERAVKLVLDGLNLEIQADESDVLPPNIELFSQEYEAKPLRG